MGHKSSQTLTKVKVTTGSGKLWFQYYIFPNKNPPDKDFLSSEAINFVGCGILLLIQYLNMWSAVWPEESGVMVAYAVVIL